MSVTAPAIAAGTARIQQADGDVRSYPNVRISIENKTMRMTSADGKGTLVIDKAACNHVGELIRCLPYGARLYQNGEVHSVTIVNGTVWFNPSAGVERLPFSSTQLAHNGVLMSLHTKNGTYVSLDGRVDVVKK